VQALRDQPVEYMNIPVFMCSLAGTAAAFPWKVFDDGGQLSA